MKGYPGEKVDEGMRKFLKKRHAYQYFRNSIEKDGLSISQVIEATKKVLGENEVV